MRYLKSISIDIDTGILEPILVKQNDSARYILFRILIDGLKFNLYNYRVIFYAVKSDGKEVFNNMQIIDADEGLVELHLTEQILSVQGLIKSEICIYGEDGVLSSMPIKFEAISSTRNANIISSNEFSALTGAITEIQTFKNTLQNKAEKSEVFNKNDGINVNDFDEITRSIVLNMEPGTVNAVLGEKNVKVNNTDFVEVTNEPYDFTPTNSYTSVGCSAQGMFCNYTDGQFVSTQNTTNYKHTAYLSCKPNTKYLFKKARSIVFFNSSKVFISGVVFPFNTVTINGITGLEITTPPNCSYIVMNIDYRDIEAEELWQPLPTDINNFCIKIPRLNVNKYILKSINNKPLIIDEFGNANLEIGNSKGEIGICFGDSITGNPPIELAYPYLMSSITGIDFINAGFGGCRWQRYRNNSTGEIIPQWDAFCMHSLATAISTNDWSYQDEHINNSTLPPYFKERLQNLKLIDWSKIKYITIAYGTNDFTDISRSTNHAFDEPSIPTDVDYFIGSVRHSLELLMKKCPQASIGIITPIYRVFQQYENSPDSDTFNNKGFYLYDICKTLIKISDEYKIPSLDNYKNSGINKHTKDYFFAPTDGTHPIYEIGQPRLAQKIGGFVLSKM